MAAGGSKVVNVEGGTTAWVEAGLPAVRGKKTMSLERQVRIVAGSLVVVGSALSFWHPAWIARRPSWGRAGLFRPHRYLRHGPASGPPALESRGRKEIWSVFGGQWPEQTMGKPCRPGHATDSSLAPA